MRCERFEIEGIAPVIPTPFKTSEAINWESLGDLIDFARAAGACAICLPAFASEYYKLSETERRQLVVEAVQRASGSVPVIGQVNGFSALHVADAARATQEAGADAVCTLVPRLFALRDADIFCYFDRILSAIDVPLIIQDFNPGGPTLSAQFIADLHRIHPHFRFVKLEEPLMASKAEAILQITNGEVGVLEGWGGMHTLELLPAGVRGIVPGLGLTDLLARVYRLASRGNFDEAFPIFQRILPQIVFSLQDIELFHHAEKRLLRARGVLRDVVVRTPCFSIDRYEEAYIDFLNAKILGLLDELGLPHNPATAAGSSPGANKSEFEQNTE